MNKHLNTALLVAAAVVAIAVPRLLTGRGDVAPVTAASTDNLQGEVISVTSGGGGRDAMRRALVRLATGQTVTATVPKGCLVFAGQTTRVAKVGDGFFVAENGKGPPR